MKLYKCMYEKCKHEFESKKYYPLCPKCNSTVVELPLKCIGCGEQLSQRYGNLLELNIICKECADKGLNKIDGVIKGVKDNLFVKQIQKEMIRRKYKDEMLNRTNH